MLMHTIVQPSIFLRVKYHKRQKLSERKVVRFAGFHANVEKTFAAFVLKNAAIVHTICWENFRNSSKLHRNCKAFLLRIGEFYRFLNQFSDD